MELNSKFSGWTFISQIAIPENISEYLVDGESAVVAFRTIRDVAVFTNKRLIIRDSQGITGKKVESYTIPYSSINMYSTEGTGHMLDFNSELELWTRAGHFKINIKKGIDIVEIDKLIASHIL